MEEYGICEALKSGRLFKPIVVWCIGTCAKMFTSEVQFGHAGACANAERETADAKNKVGKSFPIRGLVMAYSMHASTDSDHEAETRNSLGMGLGAAWE